MRREVLAPQVLADFCFISPCNNCPSPELTGETDDRKAKYTCTEKICMERYFCTFLVSEFYTIEERSGLFRGIPEVELGTGAGIQELK